MADKYGSAYNDPSVQPAPLMDVAYKGGKLRQLVSVVPVVAADNTSDRVFFGKVPSHAIPNRHSIIDHSAITGLSDFDLGDESNPDGLVDGVSLVSAGTKSAIAAVALADYGKRLWEMLGYTSDPGGDLPLFGTFKADPSTTGTIALTFIYAVD